MRAKKYHIAKIIKIIHSIFHARLFIHIVHGYFVMPSATLGVSSSFLNDVSINTTFTSRHLYHGFAIKATTTEFSPKSEANTRILPDANASREGRLLIPWQWIDYKLPKSHQTWPWGWRSWHHRSTLILTNPIFGGIQLSGLGALIERSWLKIFLGALHLPKSEINLLISRLVERGIWKSISCIAFPRAYHIAHKMANVNRRFDEEHLRYD